MIEQLDQRISIDILQKGKNKDWFVGRPFYVDYNKMHLLISDAWKHKVKGVPQGTFLLAFYDGEDGVEEALLLRALGPIKLPTDNDVVSSMIEYYKDGMETAGRAGAENRNAKLDTFTRYEFSFSGLECRILGAFYRVKEEYADGGVTKKRSITEFGADLENFYSANNYKVYKPTGKVLEYIVNQRDRNEIHGGEHEFSIGNVRYSSSRRFQKNMGDIPVFISPKDFLGKRTALFGMTRTGKSNTVKKIIQATKEISDKAKRDIIQDTEVLTAKNENGEGNLFSIQENLDPYVKGGIPKYHVGQIIFDVNGEYANANMQDDGTAIFELYKDDVTRYSVLDKPGFKVLKVNFFNEIENGFDLIKSSLSEEKSNYIKSFTSVDMHEPENYDKPIQRKTSDERKAANIFDRKKAIYLCCLYRAGFKAPGRMNKIKFYGDADTINKIWPEVKPHKGIPINQAIEWFEKLWDAISTEEGVKLLEEYKKDKEADFLDEDMKALLVFLTRKSQPGKSATLSGYRLLRSISELHTSKSDKSFEQDITESLRKGKIVIVDLSQGNPVTQKLYSERICKSIFRESMARFISNKPNNFIQFYFEEAHNLFPKKEDKDLSQVYNRIAKEGAKLNLGMTYATQEVSSISANILKNTQNWFIAHLNNRDELKELVKYYDFEDFVESLLRFSAGNDKGFVRMKTYTNPYVVPVQIDRFLANKKG